MWDELHVCTSTFHFAWYLQPVGTRTSHFAWYLLHVGTSIFHLHGICMVGRKSKRQKSKKPRSKKAGKQQKQEKQKKQDTQDKQNKQQQGQQQGQQQQKQNCLLPPVISLLTCLGDTVAHMYELHFQVITIVIWQHPGFKAHTGHSSCT